MIKANEVTVRHFLFPDDCALNTATETYKQLSIDCFSNACDNLGRTISTKETDVLHQPAAKKTRVVYQPALSKRKFPRLFDRLTYVFSTLSRSAKMDDEVNSRIAKASSVFGRLRDRVWGKKSSCLGKPQGLQASGAVFITVLPVKHAWSVYERHIQEINQFYQNCRTNQLKITWDNKAPERGLPLAGMPSIHTLLQRAQLRWAIIAVIAQWHKPFPKTIVL